MQKELQIVDKADHRGPISHGKLCLQEDLGDTYPRTQ